jgi:DNA-binding NtrC family response regulator
MPNRDAQDSEFTGLEVMVVDDEVDIRELLAEHLHSQGLRVTQMSDGQSAVAALERSNGRFDLVLTDINMPGADGFEVLSAARRANAAADVVVITGYGSRDSAQHALHLGARQYLAKPFKLGQLDTILTGIGERRAIGHGYIPPPPPVEGVALSL